MALKKSTIWLDIDEIEALDQIAKRRWRTRSDLIREGIRLVIASAEGRSRAAADDSNWLTREEEIAVAFSNAGWSVAQLAGELRVDQERAAEVMRNMRRKVYREA